MTMSGYRVSLGVMKLFENCAHGFTTLNMPNTTDYTLLNEWNCMECELHLK